MNEPLPSSKWELYAQPLFGVVLGFAGLVVGELLMDGAPWPWFVGLIGGMVIGFAISVRLRHRRERTGWSYQDDDPD